MAFTQPFPVDLFCNESTFQDSDAGDWRQHGQNSGVV